MKRDLFKELQKWKTSQTRKPLILRGARQVGKSWLVKAFGKEFESFVEINFDKVAQAKDWFKQDLNVSRLIQTISLHTHQKIIPGKTLLFFDEIQECEDAIRALRYFKEELPELHVIAAGSLLDFAIDQMGIPVGRVQFLYLYPLSFSEFLTVLGRDDLKDYIHQQGREPSIHQLLLELLRAYMFLGGMPAVIHQWLMSQDVRICQQIQDELLDAYRQDFHKYAKDRQIPYVTKVFENVSTQLGDKFMYSHIDGEVRSLYFKEALSLLEKAGIIHLCYHTSAGQPPLGAMTDERKFKAFFFDIGLAQRLLGLDVEDWLSNPLKLNHRGQIAEQFVAQEFVTYAPSYKKAGVYYWHREAKNSNAEVDFIVVKDGNVIPVEVKSVSTGRLRSLHVFLETHKTCPYGLKISEAIFANNNKIHEIPLYGIFSWFKT